MELSRIVALSFVILCVCAANEETNEITANEDNRAENRSNVLLEKIDDNSKMSASELAKRTADSETEAEEVEEVDKRSFDSISESHGMSGFAKQPIDSISGSHGMSWFEKRPIDYISESHRMSGLDKRLSDPKYEGHGLGSVTQAHDKCVYKEAGYDSISGPRGLDGGFGRQEDDKLKVPGSTILEEKEVDEIKNVK